jgi:hypothetical protein
MTQMDESTNPYQPPLTVNHGRRATLWQRWRTPTSVLLMLIGTFFLLLLNGQVFTNSLIFLFCWITSLGIWLTRPNQKPRKIGAVLLIALHLLLIGYVLLGLRASYEWQTKFNQRINQMR